MQEEMSAQFFPEVTKAWQEAAVDGVVPAHRMPNYAKLRDIRAQIVPSLALEYVQALVYFTGLSEGAERGVDSRGTSIKRA